MTEGEDRTILLIGSGPIKIGQAAEFDYSGAQACRALQEEGARVVLVNSNPATIMTDPEMADKVYLEPINTEAIAEIIRKEQPDGVIAGLGGQTGLNVTAELAEEGVLEEHDVEIMGTPLDTIYATEDRDLFRQRMRELDEPVARSTTISLDEGEIVSELGTDDLRERVDAAVDEVGGLPVIARTTYTLGGSGSGVVHDIDKLYERVRKGLRLSRNDEVLITESIEGWVELEYEVMRDADDSCIIICNMENIDPMGIHTGESTVVTPSQVIPDEGHQDMRDVALKVIRDLGIQGGCNIQFAWRDDGTPGGEYRVVEVNPRVSRSSALASKATGYPIARVTAKVALGKRLHEIDNEITGETTAAFEPAIDYIVTKVPRWPKDKFPDTDFELTTAMKSTGEAMAIGRTFPESLLKALRSSEYDPAVDWGEVDDDELESEYLERPSPDRPYAVFEAFARGYTVDEINELTDIREWYLERFQQIADAAEAAQDGDFPTAAEAGFTDQEISAIGGGEFDDTHASWLPEGDLSEKGEAETPAADGGAVSVDQVETETVDRDFKLVDTCAGEFEATTPYYYSSRDPHSELDRDELQVDRDVESVVVVGGGPIRIGQGVEFDYCSVHAVRALEEQGIEAHVVNNNPETVSTDYDTSDGLFFEPITAEEVADVVEATDADGVMVQFGGQTSVDIGHPLEQELDRRDLDCDILGTSVDAMDLAEDRDRFNRLMADLGIAQAEGGSATSEEEALELAHDIGYPVLVRPSYVLGGRAMDVVYNDDDLKTYIEEAIRVSPDNPILVDEFLADAVELDVDAVADEDDVLIGGVMEHVETAGVHSGDSACMIPPRSPEIKEVMPRIREVVEDIADALDTVGLLNVQLAVRDGEVYVLEANPRSSRTVPFIAKTTGVPLAKIAAKVMAGADLSELDYEEHIPEQVSVKEVVLPFDRLPNSDPRLGPEMKSTGEVMGTAGSFGKAYQKAQQSVGKPIPLEGTAVVDLPVLGFEEHLDVKDFEDFEDVDAIIQGIQDGEIDLVVSRDRDVLEACVEEEVTYFSTLESAEAALEAINSADEPLSVQDIASRPKSQREWGEE
ncbi:carbamoyl-phosphate synthase large subunit [Halomicrobium salinisoli]|uniref:carbamoyl-phosphate synthase large subunit n=1 Tax=Halomicrobium salinisoli TaxID=2878391 RepID=UPI001CF03DD9|nr:carbamoyl-phosphate synthase large subunit [Halomicrobium salinisoli]